MATPSQTFTDPTAQVFIKNPTTGDEWFFTAPDSPFLVGATIQYEQGRMAKAEASFDIPYEDAVARFMSPPSPFAVNNVMHVRIGYASGLFTPWAVGALTKGGDGLSIDANGVTGSVSTESLAASTFFTVGRDFPYTTYLEQLTYIAEYMGLELAWTPTVQDALDSDNPYPLRQLTIWEALKDICADNNLRWLIGPNPMASEITNPYDAQGRVLFIYVESDTDEIIAPAGTVRKYVLRGSLDVAKNQYPCFQWSPDAAGGAAWANMGSVPDAAEGGVITQAMDTDTNELTWDKILPAEQEVTLVGGIAFINPSLDLIYEGVTGNRSKIPNPYDGEPEPGESISLPLQPGADGVAQVKRKIARKQSDGNAGQQGSITTIGVPEERCANKCSLSGCGKMYDGPYDITGIVHTFANASYDMTMTVFRLGAVEKGTDDHRETQKGQATDAS